VVREVASAAGAREAWYNPCIAMHCPETGFKRPEGADPSDGRGVQLRWDTLVPDSADPHVIRSKWKYANEESDCYITSCVKYAPSTCLRHGQDLVAWIGLHWDMSLGFLWVQEEFRMRGLGKALAACQIIKTFDYVRNHLDPVHVGAYLFTESVNTPSKVLFQSMGFQIIDQVFWACFSKTNAEVQVVPSKHNGKSIDKVNLAEKFALFDQHWSPKIIGEVDDFDVKIAKLKGEFVWHKHENEDELFIVIKGRLTIKVRVVDEEKDIELCEGEIFIVPKNVEHKPVAVEECHVMLLERRGVLNTGNLRNQRTVDNLEHL